jgi:hypothetical protein
MREYRQHRGRYLWITWSKPVVWLNIGGRRHKDWRERLRLRLRVRSVRKRLM